MLSESKLAELLSTKLCHDLAGPIGAIDNSVEYLKEANDSIKDRARSLLETSSSQASRRLQFFRQIFGVIPDSGYANLDNVFEITKNYFLDSKIDLIIDYSNLSAMNLEITHLLGKIIMNLIYSAKSSIIKEGNLKVVLSPSSGEIVKIIAEGSVIKYDISNINMMLGIFTEEEIKPSNVNFYYLHNLISRSNAELRIQNLNEKIEYRLFFTK